ncbi:His Kinase A domain containing protein [Arthrobotrys musiformis]|uniref:histidine kinase n=1 Tax=Arthrobotrys musiformis TaxID=47236 RepID=A0AAV9W5N9_9PEZI
MSSPTKLNQQHSTTPTSSTPSNSSSAPHGSYDGSSREPRPRGVSPHQTRHPQSASNLTSPQCAPGTSVLSADSPSILPPSLAVLTLGPSPNGPPSLVPMPPISRSGSGSESSYDSHPQFFSTPPSASPISRSVGPNPLGSRMYGNLNTKMPDIDERSNSSETGSHLSGLGNDMVATVRFGKRSSDTISLNSTAMTETTNGDGYTNLNLMYSINYMHVYRAQSKSTLAPMLLKTAEADNVDSLTRLRWEWKLFSGSDAENGSLDTILQPSVPGSSVASPSPLSQRGLLLPSHSSSSNYSLSNLSSHPNIVSPMLMDYFPDGAISLVYDDKRSYQTAKEWFLPERKVMEEVPNLQPLDTPYETPLVEPVARGSRTSSIATITAPSPPPPPPSNRVPTPKPRTQNDLIGILTVVYDIVNVLGVIHSLGIIHNNVNPYTVLVTPGIPPKGYLFGWHLATRHGRDEVAHDHTGSIIALRDNPSPLQYIAPECTGRMNRVVDYRADFYSLGITMYELCVGFLPFRAVEPLELIHQHIAKPPAAPSEVNQSIPVTLSKVILKLLEKNVEDRYQTASGLQADLEVLIKHLNEGLSLDDYVIGEADANSQFSVTDKLYGRENVLKSLQESYATVREKRSSALVLIGGGSGTGKSRLVQEVQKAVVKNKGYFTSGKFEQYKRNTTFFSLIQTLQDLVRQVLSESIQNLEKWRVDAIRALDGEALVLLEVIPEMKLLLGPEYKPDVLAALGPSEREQRFRTVFVRFLSIFARHSLVVFLDDLQWCSSTEFNLIANIAAQANSNGQGQSILIVGAYRNNEVTADHPLYNMIDRVRQHGVPVNDLEIGDLDVESVGKIVADTFRRPFPAALTDLEAYEKEDTEEHASPAYSAQPHDAELRTLTELVFAKTHGNAFFVTQLLKSLHRGGHIWFDFNERIWRFSLSTIETDELPDGVVDLLVKQMMSLSEETREIMRVAACLGHGKISIETLSIACGKTLEQAEESLWGALDAGLMLPMNTQYHAGLTHEVASQLEFGGITPYMANRYPAVPADLTQAITYRFLHDRVQQAAYSLIPEDQLQQVHRTIGTRLLANTTTDKMDLMIYEITNHLNYWQGPLTREESRKLITLNFEAGKRALQTTAFNTALNYFNQARRLLDEGNEDEDNYMEDALGVIRKVNVGELRLNVTMSLAEAQFAESDYEAAIDTIQKLLDDCSLSVNKSRCLLLKMKYLMAMGRLQDTTAAGLSALSLLGYYIPEDEASCKRHAAALRASCELDSIDLALVKVMENRKHSTADILLHEICAGVLLPIYMSQPELLPSICLTSFRATLKSGLCIESAYPIVMLAVMISGEGGEHNLSLSWKLGHMAVTLVEKEMQHVTPTNAPAIFQVFAGHIACFHRGMSDVLKYEHLALVTAQAIFEVDYQGFASAEIPAFSMLSGERLESVALKMNTSRASTVRQNYRLGEWWLRMPYQVLLNLRGLGNTNPVKLEGAEMTQEDINSLMCSESVSHLYALNLYKIVLAVLFGDMDTAYESIMKGTRPQSVFMISSIYLSWSHFYGGFALIDRLHKLTPDETRYLHDTMQQLKDWSLYAKETFLHKYLALEAELHKDTESTLTTLDRFEEAIQLANQSQFYHEAALINERCAMWLSKQGTKRWLSYLREAYKLYSWWGATAKLQALRNTYSEELGMKFRHTMPPSRYSDADLPVSAVRPVLSRNTSEGAVQAPAQLQAGLVNFSPRPSKNIVQDDDDSHISRSSNIEPFAESELDYKTFMKASLYISEGVQMDEVVVKLMKSVLQTAGADYGVLILEEDGDLYAETILFMEKVTILDHQPLKARPDLVPLSIASIVWKLGEPIVRNGHDEKFDSTYGRDAYFATKHPKSVLCMPIQNQIKTMGVLYLENKHVNHAFTSQRLELLNLLCTQAAVTIDKARLYRAMELAKKAAEEATEEKSSFLANMSHEIRTPFNALLSYAIFLLDTSLTDQQREYVETIRNSAILTLKIIDGILDFSKMEHGPVDLQKSPFSLRDCVEGALQLIAEPAATKDLELVFENKCPAVEVVFGDVTRFRQIIINLVGNAVKFTEKGHILVTAWIEHLNQATSSQDDEEKVRINVTVNDTGIGIPLKAREKLFRAFSQVDSSTRRLYGGSGLGLAISKKLAQSMGGDIVLDSVEGQGSTFHLTILAPVGIKEPQLDKRLVGKKVLIADTHELSSKTLEKELSREGLVITRTDTVISTMTAIRSGGIRVAIVDFSLDESLRIAASINKIDSSVKIILQARFGTTVPALDQHKNVTASIVRPAPRQRYIQNIQEALDPRRREPVKVEDPEQEMIRSLGSRHPLHILLAEDNPLNTRVALQHLKRMGYTAAHAKDGIEVLEMVEVAASENNQYDVILMDVQMPRSDGIETSRELMKRYPDSQRPTIIALTANATPSDREKCLQAGMLSHIAKPIKPDDLAAALMSTKPMVRSRGGSLGSPSVSDAGSNRQDQEATKGL